MRGEGDGGSSKAVVQMMGTKESNEVKSKFGTSQLRHSAILPTPLMKEF